jgi:hypothetical protein
MAHSGSAASAAGVLAFVTSDRPSLTARLLQDARLVGTAGTGTDL